MRHPLTGHSEGCLCPACEQPADPARLALENRELREKIAIFDRGYLSLEASYRLVCAEAAENGRLVAELREKLAKAEQERDVLSQAFDASHKRELLLEARQFRAAIETIRNRARELSAPVLRGHLWEHDAARRKASMFEEVADWLEEEARGLSGEGERPSVLPDACAEIRLDADEAAHVAALIQRPPRIIPALVRAFEKLDKQCAVESGPPAPCRKTLPPGHFCALEDGHEGECRILPYLAG